MRRAEVQCLDLIEATDRQKNYVPTDIFKQEHKEPLSRGQEKSLENIQSGARKASHSYDLGKLPRECLPQGKGILR